MKLFLLIIMIWNIQAQATDMQRSIMNALYKQTGAEDYVNTTAKNLDKEYVPDIIRKRGAIALILLQGTITHQLVWKWSF